MNQKKPRKYQKHQQNNAKWIPVVVAIVGFLLIGAAFFAFREKPGAAIEVTGSASLKVDKEKVDLGDVPLNQPVKVSFLLTNVGDETLRFTEDPYVEVVEGC